MTIDEAIQRWALEQPKYQAFAVGIADELRRLAEVNALHANVSAREKDRASFRTKCITKAYDDPWVEITDKAGARVVLPGYSDVDHFCRLIEASERLEVLRVEDKRDFESPDQFGYSGVHVQVLAEHDGERLECEIQVRTIAQDAWSVVSHKLMYKAPVDLPKAEKHAIYRLVALIELFDQEVGRVASQVAVLPGHEHHALLEVAEGLFEGAAHSISNRELSAYVLDQIKDVVPNDEAYVESVRDFAREHAGQIAHAIETYGPKSDVPQTFRWALFSQAEMIILLERLNSDPIQVQQAWDVSDLPNEWLASLGTYSEADIFIE